MTEKKALSTDELEDVSGGMAILHRAPVSETDSVMTEKPNLKDLNITNVMGPKKLPPGMMV